MKYKITQSRLLYVMSIDDRKHKGLLKVGEVFVDNEIADSNDKQLYNNAIREILDSRSYMHGVGSYRLEYVECTTYEQSTKCYKADDVLRTLRKMEVPSKMLGKIKGNEVDIWFACFVDEVKEAIKKIKNGRGAGHGDIKFRPEQEQAIDDTVSYFQREFKDEKKGKSFLWNAKMRFGKTLSGLEVAKRMDYKSTLIQTCRWPILQLHAESQTSRGQNFLDLIQRLATQVRCLEQLVFCTLNVIADVINILCLQAIR